MHYEIVPVQVPPLTVHFINDSPRVINTSMEADIVVSRPAQSLVCSLRSAFVDLSVNCEFILSNNFLWHCMLICIKMYGYSLLGLYDLVSYPISIDYMVKQRLCAQCLYRFKWTCSVF